MKSSSSKIYLRPFSFVGKREGRKLYLKKEALNLAGGLRYFRNIEIIRRSRSSTDFFSVKEFLKLAKINKPYKQALNKITEKRGLFTNKKFFYKKDYVIFGILNITPDSFSDGGDFVSEDNAFM